MMPSRCLPHPGEPSTALLSADMRSGLGPAAAMFMTFLISASLTLMLRRLLRDLDGVMVELFAALFGVGFGFGWGEVGDASCVTVVAGEGVRVRDVRGCTSTTE